MFHPSCSLRARHLKQEQLLLNTITTEYNSKYCFNKYIVLFERVKTWHTMRKKKFEWQRNREVDTYSSKRAI